MGGASKNPYWTRVQFLGKEKSGVLATNPGSFSYGLGATILGRVIEVAHQKGSSTYFKNLNTGRVSLMFHRVQCFRVCQ